MATPLLAAKTYLPRPVSGRVERARLRERLDQALSNQRRLVLVSALAGSGKSTLLADWAATAALPCAWFSLDAQDNQPSLFWAYLITALQRQSPGFAQALLVELLSPQAPPAERFLPEFLNQAAQLPGRIVIVLDDYHLIENPAIHDSLIFLIEHLPETLLVAICTRSDPPMPLSRWRVRGYLAEVRLPDLRFTSAETQAFLRDVMKLSLDDDDITRLEARTEGWAAGLQLAALALQESFAVNDREAQKNFIARFSASHQYVLDYLTSEVLAHLPDESHHFLVQTSILKQLCGPLCRAVTGDPDSATVLSALVHKNLFLVPLDAEGAWYRYHHLFAEMLQMHLERQGAEAIAQLHLRAAQWHEQAGRVDDSLYHALQAGAVDYAVEVILQNWQQVIYRGWPNQVLGWLEALPVQVVQEHPSLSIALAWTQWIRGQAQAAQVHSDEALQAYERWLALGKDPARERASIPGEVATLRAMAAVRFERFDAALEYSTQAIKMLSADKSQAAAFGLALMAQAAAMRESLKIEPAIETYYQVIEVLLQVGNLVALGASGIALGRLFQLQGRLAEAADFYRDLLARMGPNASSPAVGILQVGLGEVLYEQNDLEQAAALLRPVWNHMDRRGFWELVACSCLLQARLFRAAGQTGDAIAVLQEGTDSLRRSDPLDFLKEIQSLLAVYLAEEGQVAEAWRLLPDPLAMGERLPGLSLGSRLLNQARVGLVAGRAEATLAFAAQCEQLAAGAGSRRWQMEALLLQALAQAKLGKRTAGQSALQKSLALAQSQGYLRLFLDGGEAVHDLLVGLYPTLTDPALAQFARRILEAFPAPAPKKPLTPPSLTSPLSEREVQILRLLSLGLSNQAVADQLYISLATVKTHIRHIFEKLGAENRIEALNKAKELHLF
jgi:LuxR family maltose regulon positive regulatory protein